MLPPKIDPITGQPIMPYDQSAGPSQMPPASPGAPDPTMADPSQGGAPPAGLLSQMGGAPPAPAGASVAGAGDGTDALTGDQLAQLLQGGGQADMSQAPPPGIAVVSPEDQQAAQLEQALTDPNTPPDQKSQIEAMIALSARRGLAGLGGQG